MPVTQVSVEDLYAKDKNVKLEDVRLIQEWLDKQPHLPPLEEYQIVTFLHSCYYKTNNAKNSIDKYFTIRTAHPEIFDRLDENTLKSTLKCVFSSILPDKTPDGYAVLFVKLLNPSSSVYVFSHLVTVITMVLTLYMHQKGFENGGVVIFDTKNFSFTHLIKTSLGVLKNALYHVQEGAPLRIKGIHFINVVPAIEKLKILAKPFLKAELYNMIEFHSSMDTLYKQVPQKCLAQDYGGQAPSVQLLHEQNLENLLDNYEYFRWHDLQKVDESKRNRKSRWSIFGWNS